jgi:hypothetical protein
MHIASPWLFAHVHPAFSFPPPTQRIYYVKLYIYYIYMWQNTGHNNTHKLPFTVRFLVSNFQSQIF